MVSGLHQFGLSVTPGGRKLRETQHLSPGLSHAADYMTMASRLAALHKKRTVDRRLRNSEAVETTHTVSNVTGSIVEGMVDRRS